MGRLPTTRLTPNRSQNLLTVDNRLQTSRLLTDHCASHLDFGLHAAHWRYSGVHPHWPLITKPITSDNTGQTCLIGNGRETLTWKFPALHPSGPPRRSELEWLLCPSEMSIETCLQRCVRHMIKHKNVYRPICLVCQICKGSLLLQQRVWIVYQLIRAKQLVLNGS